ncbi:MAG: maleylpyruvate isomerase N-terminal domain-containing protein [Spirochaetia bacterium]|jgi:hypothetical protein
MGNAYSEQNTAWRQKLAAVVQRLSDKDMGRTTGTSGWTVAGVLGHLAFYDQRALTLLNKWEKDGITPTSIDINVVNDAMRPLLNAVSPRAAARLIVEAATAIDAAIEGLDASFLKKIESDGTALKLNRATHREHHLAQIERVLSAS